MSRSAVIFDFDGTITEPLLDFDVIRATLGIDGGPILEAIANWSTADRARAEIVLAEHERAAAESARLRDGAVETLAALRAEGHPLAILTRNARRWVDLVLERFGIRIDAIRTREDGAIKPSPAPVHALCAELGVASSRCWMVGDHEMDILTGRAAGTRTVQIVDRDASRPLRVIPDHVIHELPDLLPIVRSV